MLASILITISCPGMPGHNDFNPYTLPLLDIPQIREVQPDALCSWAWQLLSLLSTLLLLFPATCRTKFSEGKKNKKLKYFYCFKTLVFYIWAKMFNSFIEKHSTSDNIIYEWTVNNYFAQKKKTLLLVLQASRYYSKFVFISTINNFYIYLWSNFATLFSLLIFNLGCS